MTEAFLKTYREWRKQANEQLPALAARVFALRGVAYAGYGFHYALEESLGKVIAQVASPEIIPTLAQSVAIQAGFELLEKQVTGAEESAKRIAVETQS